LADHIHSVKPRERFYQQFHWNNPQEIDNYTDSSGMTLYYTTRKRLYDSGILMTGDQQFAIPPGETNYTVGSDCTAACTQKYMNR
jgi:hypothetical protein